MNKFAMLHIADSSYCFPISKNEIVLRLRTGKDDIACAQVLYESKYVIGEKQKSALMLKTYTGEIFDYYEVKLTLEDTRLAYVFYVNDGEKNYYFSEDGVTESYDFTIGFYNFFQYPYINENDIMECVPWMKNAVFYQIFVDRFYQGDTKKDLSYINCNWGDIPKPTTFAGGDLKGIIKKLDYIKNVGCNTLYLTPVFRSISNHKYDISDYYNVDSQFGSNEDLKELVQTAHKKGIRVILDAVFNHCSERISQFQDVLEKGDDSRYFDWFIIYGDKINEKKDNYEVFASCTYMPKWNTTNEEVQQYLIDIGTYYLTEYDIDGWRLDVSDEVSHNFWRKFRTAIKEKKTDAVIIGENWHDANSYLRGDQYDSIMNYSFTKLCLDYFAKNEKNAQQAAGKLNEILVRNTNTVNKMMLNLLDSHDTHRFYKEVGKNREKMKAAICLLYFFRGVPCIFYGTEILTEGGYDPDCRRCMDWEKADDRGEYKDIYSLLQNLSNIRQKYNFADSQMCITSMQDVLIIEHKMEEDEFSLYINLTNETKSVKEVMIKPLEYVICQNGEVVAYE